MRSRGDQKFHSAAVTRTASDTPVRRASGVGSSTSEQQEGLHPDRKQRPSYYIWNVFGYFDSEAAAKNAITRNSPPLSRPYNRSGIAQPLYQEVGVKLSRPTSCSKLCNKKLLALTKYSCYNHRRRSRSAAFVVPIRCQIIDDRHICLL